MGTYSLSYDPIPTVSPSVGGAPQLGINASPEKFGATIGQAEQGLGQGVEHAGAEISQVAAQRQHEINVLSANDGLFNYSDNANQLMTDFSRLEGKARMAALPDHLKALNELSNRTISSAENDQQKMLVSQAIRSEQTRLSNVSRGMYDEAQKTWAHGQAQAGIQHSVGMVVSNAADPTGVEMWLGKTEEMTREAGMLHGLSSEQIDEQVRQTKGAAIHGAVVGLAQGLGGNPGNPQAARQLLDKYRDQIDPLKAQEADAFLYDRVQADIGQKRGLAEVTGANPKNVLSPQAAAESRAMLQHFEGYKDQPYWDVNHWRVGYGSDTITKADGTVQTVAPGMKITAEDADRDLQRRVGLTQKGIQASIGADRWNSLPASAQSALTSISYNYGKDGYLPANVLNAAKSGSLQDISAAIAARAEDNGGVNSSRRQQEAGAVLGQFTAGTPNYEAMKAQAYKNVTSSDLSPLAQQHALQTINRSLSAQEIADNVTIKARSEANEAARGEYFGQIVHGQIDGLQEKILSDPRLKPETQEHLVGLLKKESGENDTSTYGPGYAEVYKGLVAPPGAPNRITDANAILQRGAPGGDLTIKGVDRLLKIQKDATKDPDAASTHRVISNLEQYAKGKMTYAEESQIPGYKGLADPKGTALFQSTFIPQFEAAYEQAAKSGKGREFLTKDNVDSMVKQLRSAQQIAQDKMEEMTGAAKVEIPPPPEGVEPQRWQAEVQNPAHGYSPQRWGQILTILTSNPTEERQKSFDSHFGPRGARPAAEIVKDLHVGQ